MNYFLKRFDIEEEEDLLNQLSSEKDKKEPIKEKEKEKPYKKIFFYKIILIFLCYLILTEVHEEIKPVKIKVAFYYRKMNYGGVERVLSLLLNLLSNEKTLSMYLITHEGISENEYPTPKNIHRICLSDQKINLFQAIRREHIDIIIYNSYEIDKITKLNNLKKTKVIAYDHSSYFLWLFLGQLNIENTMYITYKKCNCVISLIPLENDYLLKRWGINSVFIDNPFTFDYDSVTPSNLSQHNIVMIGRSDQKKRYEIGINAMKSIITEAPDSKMYIIADSNEKLEELIKSLNLEKSVKFTGFQKNIEIYLKNASLHIFPSITEAYPMVLGEVKIYGIPTILCGLDFLALAKGGTIIIYDDNAETVAKEAIKILKNETYRKILGKEARKSLENKNNNSIARRWIKLLYSLYYEDDKAFQELSAGGLSEEEAEHILKNQLKLLKMRFPKFENITLDQLKNYKLS